MPESRSATDSDENLYILKSAAFPFETEMLYLFVFTQFQQNREAVLLELL